MNINVIKTITGSDYQTDPSKSVTSIVNFSSSGNYHSFEKHLWYMRDFYQLDITDTITDLYRLASAIFIVDKLIDRSSSYDNWTRNLLLYLPVHSIDLWNSNKSTLLTLLNFLTGDHWDLQFVTDTSITPTPNKQIIKQGFKLSTTSVSLFSGGLDSFVGVIDSLNECDSIALVSHSDHAHISKTQKRIYESILKHYPDKQVNLAQLFLQPQNSQENTTRSRSLLFFTLGTVIANATKTKLLLVPENGMISINSPLTTGRLGSLSTKTTHPYTLYLFNMLLEGIGINIVLVNPYQFKTKGEMICDSKDNEFVKALYSCTMSCSHSTAARWEGKPSNKHCGYCLPCLIRRAALDKNQLDNPNDYSYDIHDQSFIKQNSEKLDDFHALLYAIEAQKSTSSVSKVLSSGPLLPSSKIDDFVGIYERGLSEIKRFIEKT